MKNSIYYLSARLLKGIIIVQFISVLSCNDAKAQTVVYGDQVRLKISNSYRGTVIWQKSLDSILWTDIAGATQDTLDITATIAANYRAKIIEGTCQPVYSGVRHISVRPLICGTDSINYASKGYHTVLIGTQCWLKENINAGTMIVQTATSSNNGIIEKYCYDDLKSNCDIYGGLYNWYEIMNYAPSSNTNPSGVQGVCPTGWHIPSDVEWTQLIDLTNGNPGGQLKEAGTTHWESTQPETTNATGFTALPGGYYNPSGTPKFNMLYKHADFWTSTESITTTAIKRKFAQVWAAQYDKIPDSKFFAFSIRCVKN